MERLGGADGFATPEELLADAAGRQEEEIVLAGRGNRLDFIPGVREGFEALFALVRELQIERKKSVRVHVALVVGLGQFFDQVVRVRVLAERAQRQRLTFRRAASERRPGARHAKRIGGRNEIAVIFRRQFHVSLQLGDECRAGDRPEADRVEVFEYSGYRVERELGGDKPRESVVKRHFRHFGAKWHSNGERRSGE